MPTLEPGLHGMDKDHASYTWLDGPLFDGPPSMEDINQGGVGDCWFLAAMGAELKHNPNFVQQHLRDNSNGTYTVTLYQDGKPVPVTVDGAVPTDSGGQSIPFADGAPNWQTGGPAWVSIYEKAFAQLNGSYQGIDSGGYGSDGMSLLTGRKAERTAPFFTPLVEVAKRLHDGQPVTVGTDSHHSGFFWTHSDEYFDHGKLVTNHEYTVVSVDTNAHPPTIKLRNPWGPDAGAPEYVTLTEDEYMSHCVEVSFGDS